MISDTSDLRLRDTGASSAGSENRSEKGAEEVNYSIFGYMIIIIIIIITIPPPQT